MAKTLEIAGINFLPQYQTNSAQIREIIQNKSNVLNMNIIVKPGENTPQEGSEVVFKDGSRFLFAGFISRTSPEEVGLGEMFNYSVEVSDYSYIFGSKIARRAYINKTLKEIVTDLMDEYVDATYGFDLTNVADGPMIKSITFDHISVRKCFEKLQKLTGYVWYVDYEKKLFFALPTAEPAPETITDTSDNFMNISLSYDTSQVRNSVIVIGSANGEQSESYTEETFVGDGDTMSWELGDKPSQIVFIKVNGVDQQFSLDLNRRDTDIFLYSFSGATFSNNESVPPFTGSDTIVVRYYPRIPIVVRRQNISSINFFKALDGGDGVYEYTVKDTSITSKASAGDRASQELKDYAMPLVNGTFVTRTGLLAPGSIFATGQYMTINLPSYGITIDAAFLVQEVNITLLEQDGVGDTEYTYTIRFGGKIIGVQEFLEAMAPDTAANEVSDTNNIITIEQLTDEEYIDDNSDTLTHVIATPPYKYSPGTPLGKWNLSEWS